MIQKNTGGLHLEAVVERSYLWDVFVNGVKLKPNEKEWWLDKNFSVFGINAYVQEGEKHDKTPGTTDEHM